MLTLGSTSGVGNNKVEATSVGFTGQVVFTASATENAPHKINIGSGNNQRGAVITPLPNPLVAVVTDEGHNVIKGVPVTFTVTGGGGNLNGAAATVVNTDSDGRATVSFTLGTEEGLDNNVVTANFAGNTTAAAIFRASGLAVGDPGDTSISGVVLDNSNIPIPGVTLRVDGTTREGVTDDEGQFMILSVPVGPLHLIVDGSTTPLSGEFPVLSFEIVTVAGQNNTLGMPIYLLPLNTENVQWVGGSDDVIYELENIPGFSLNIKANSVTFPDGTNEGFISVTQVHADKIPMEPPNGLQPRFIITIQPPGAVFDPPAPITIPNVDGLAPGEITEMYSFDHDLGQFVSIGTGTVSEDGMVIASDPGVGIIKAGWHCGGDPAQSGCTHVCGTCKKCEGDCKCVADDSNTGGLDPCNEAEISGEIAIATNLLKEALKAIPFVSDPTVNGTLSGSNCPICCNGNIRNPGIISFGGTLTGEATLSHTFGIDLGPYDVTFPVFGNEYTLVAEVKVGPTISGTPSLTASAGGKHNFCDGTNCFTFGGCGKITITAGLDGTATVAALKNGTEWVSIGLTSSGTAKLPVNGRVDYDSCGETVTSGCLGDLTGDIIMKALTITIINKSDIMLIPGGGNCDC